MEEKSNMDEQQLQHFSHEHPLMLTEQHNDVKPALCQLCGDRVLGPRYSCNQCSDNFVLHKSCAQQPREILQHPLHSKHPLVMKSQLPRRNFVIRMFFRDRFCCSACGAPIHGRYYSCDPCDVLLHVKCAFNFRNIDGILHFSHQHVLTLSTENQSAEGPSTCFCTGCLQQVLGPRYICEIFAGRQRRFSISPEITHEMERSCSSIVLHQSCAKLDREIQHPTHRQHPLTLNLNGARESHCDVCDLDCSRRFTYSCVRCYFNLHPKCTSFEVFEHFSHNHPLMFKMLGDKKKESVPLVICDACQDPVVGPSYTCINTYLRRKCCFNLHKSCAELPVEIQHPVHHQHPLFLLNAIPIQKIKVRCSCNACNQPCIYRYSCSTCDFNLDLKCASNWRKIIENESHEHQLTVPRKEMTQLHLTCDVCGEFRSDTDYYVCSICQLWVHKECASFPRDTKIPRHQHSLKLTWFLEDIYPKDQVCNICSTNIDKCRTVYYCQECCGYVAHTTCIFQKEENQDSTVNIEDDDFKSGDAGEIIHFSHQHPLVANRVSRWRQVRRAHFDTVYQCEGCIRPIISKDFYGCTRQEEESCHFYLHKKCARLPEKMILPLLDQQQFILHSRAPSIDEVFQCYMCGIFHQGFVYCCAFPKGEKPVYLDPECSIYWENRDLKHESHPHRLLLDWEDVHCRGCGSKIIFCFSCKRCNFHLCIACVRLPPTAEHRYDTHTLKLTYESIEDELGEYYCEICEGKRDPAHWFYWCKECEFDCHPHCIIGRYPRVKLERNYKHEAHVQHPVTLVSKWKSPIRDDKRDNILPCEKCGELCEGLVFECKECNINFHREGCCVTTHSESSLRSPQIEELS